MIKKPPSKQDIRAQLESDTARFLSGGQQIDVIPKGVSSRDEAGSPPRRESWQMEKSSGERTYLPEVIEALESRRKPEKAPVKSLATKKKKPRKRLIYDDFGEPLRWVWVDE